MSMSTPSLRVEATQSRATLIPLRLGVARSWCSLRRVASTSSRHPTRCPPSILTIPHCPNPDLYCCSMLCRTVREFVGCLDDIKCTLCLSLRVCINASCCLFDAIVACTATCGLLLPARASFCLCLCLCRRRRCCTCSNSLRSFPLAGDPPPVSSWWRA